MPEYALTLHFGAPDEEHARKRAADIADVCAAEHGTRDPVVVPVVASEIERLRGDLATVMRIVTAWCVEYNDFGGVDAEDLAWRLEEAGHPLPDPEEVPDAS